MTRFGIVCTSVFGKGAREPVWHEEGQMNNESMEGLGWNKNCYDVALRIEIEWWVVLEEVGYIRVRENYDVAFI